MKLLLVRLGLIALAVLVVHGPALRNGLLLDDFNHRAQLQDGDYSFRSLVDASHLGGHGRRVEMWWQDDADLVFFRPVAFLLMRVEYQIGRWSPVWMHACSLMWALGAALLVVHLAQRTLADRRWATLAGLLFVLHPANVLTVQWIACQNEQMATVFLLGGLAAYGSYARWWNDQPAPAEGRRSQRLATALVCFVAALACRETAVIFLPLVVLGDWIVARERFRNRWGGYAVFLAITIGYLALRHWSLGGFVMPSRPYAYPPSDPGFARFAFDKSLYYLLGLFVYLPIVGFAGLPALRAHPFLFYGAAGAVIVICSVILYLLRQRRTTWIWALLVVLPLAPVLPVFASSHHLYLPSAGMVLILVTVCLRIRQWAAENASAGPLIGGAVMAWIGLQLVVTPAADYLHGAGISGFSAASQMVVDETSRLGPEFKPGDHLFFLNLPMLAFNCVPAIEHRTGVEPLNGHVLTFASGLIGMGRPGNVQRVGPKQLRVSTDPPGFFAGLAGRSMLEAIGRSRPFAEGETFSTGQVDVTVLRSDRHGITELLFAFNRPLHDPSYHFFLGSADFAAYPLRFAPNADRGR